MLRSTATLLAATALTSAAALAAVPSSVETVRTAAGNIRVSEVADGLVHPWGMAFLPDGRMLLTERPGRLRLVAADGSLRDAPVEGTPEVWAEGQGGLLDVVVDPDFASNGFVWLTFAEAGENGTAGTAVGRGRWNDDRLEDFRTVWRQHKVEGPNHFGSRIVFDDQGTLFVALGERFKFQPAQDLSNALGTVIRITRDGEPADGNPFVDRADAEPAIYSCGHRNIQAAARDPESGDVYVAEMGPLGGDELNRIEKAANYGWPVVSWGTDYDGAEIPDPPTRPEFQDALGQWTPVISPSGMIFYRGDAFPEFRGQSLIGGLVSQGITRVAIADGRIDSQEHIPLGDRVRDVEEGPDGNLYVLIDREDGHLWKLEPMR